MIAVVAASVVVWRRGDCDYEDDRRVYGIKIRQISRTLSVRSYEFCVGDRGAGCAEGGRIVIEDWRGFTKLVGLPRWLTKEIATRGCVSAKHRAGVHYARVSLSRSLQGCTPTK